MRSAVAEGCAVTLLDVRIQTESRPSAPKYGSHGGFVGVMKDSSSDLDHIFA